MIDTTLTLRWRRMGDHELPIPSRAHPTDAGLDLPVVVDPTNYQGHPTPIRGRIEAHPERIIVFRTGWAVEIPPGWFGLVVVRSSIGKAGWDIESSGVIDPSYRGEIFLPLIYRGDSLSAKRFVSHGDRMAQMLILPVPEVQSVEVAELSDTPRGAGGFGSTNPR